MYRPSLPLALLALAALPALAQQPFPPPPRAYLPTPQERQRLDQARNALATRLEELPAAQSADAAVFLHLNEISDRLSLYTTPAQVQTVLRGLETGRRRCDALARGERPWSLQPGRSLRGCVSRVDGSVQPYGVVLPAGFDAKSPKKWRLEVFLHGRGTSEPRFLTDNEPAPGSAAARPPDGDLIQLHPFGRANNGWRWAGETDIFEALEQVKRQYPIDPDRIVLRGFSMGGHGAWHVGVHYPGLWAAVSPGAGFSETRRHGGVKGEVPAYQEAGWHIYDAVDWALNLFDTPFIAYGGDHDPQLQAALNMKAAAEKEGLPFSLVVGPDTEHRYHPDSLREIQRQLAVHRRDPSPREVRFVTWTLKYNQCRWVTVDGLEQHYRRAEVRAAADGDTARVTTANVSALTLDPLPDGVRRLQLDGQDLEARGSARLERRAGKWRSRRGGSDDLRKRHGLQGPIDDAFMEPFLVVRPTRAPWHAGTGAYVDAALARFREDWRFGFRAELPEKDDRSVSAADLRDRNLVLFGDPASNEILDRVDARLPLRWTAAGLEMNGKRYGTDALPVLIFPSPFNPRRYVVVNTGHTFGRRDLDASNAWLFPKLGDWAVVRAAAGDREVLDAGFFNERWRLDRE